jgi:hypothetical protein
VLSLFSKGLYLQLSCSCHTPGSLPCRIVVRQITSPQVVDQLSRPVSAATSEVSGHGLLFAHLLGAPKDCHLS